MSDESVETVVDPATGEEVTTEPTEPVVVEPPVPSEEQPVEPELSPSEQIKRELFFSLDNLERLSDSMENVAKREAVKALVLATRRVVQCCEAECCS